MEWLRIKLGLSEKLIINSEGHSGKLCMMWKEEQVISLLSFSIHHIDVQVSDSSIGNWRVTGFYGSPSSAQKRHSWTLLKRLAGLSNLPWVVGGDFNAVMWTHEKQGGSGHSGDDMAMFREALDICDLQDLGYLGPAFIWSNKRRGDLCIEERLDRFVGNMKWRDLFPRARVKHLDFWKSDHRPILLFCEGSAAKVVPKKGRGRSRFHYEECWEKDEEYSAIIKSSWSLGQGSLMQCLLECLKKCGSSLRQRNSSKIQRLNEEVKHLRKDLHSLNNQVLAQS